MHNVSSAHSSREPLPSSCNRRHSLISADMTSTCRSPHPTHTTSHSSWRLQRRPCRMRQKPQYQLRTARRCRRRAPIPSQAKPAEIIAASIATVTATNPQSLSHYNRLPANHAVSGRISIAWCRRQRWSRVLLHRRIRRSLSRACGKCIRCWLVFSRRS